MTTTASPMTHTQSTTSDAVQPAPFAALHTLLERLDGYWRSSREARNDSAVERFIQENGGALTDDLEREISRRFGRMAGPL